MTGILLFVILCTILGYFIFNFVANFLHIDDFIFLVSVSIILTLGFLQTLTLWYLLVTSKPVTTGASIGIVLTLVILMFFVNIIFMANRSNIFTAFDLTLCLLPVVVVIIAAISTFTLGDTGWDSNAYHIPLIGMLTNWGSNNWPDSISEGTFTIYTPYGAHSVQSLFVAIFSDYRAATIPSALLFIGGTLIGTTLVIKKLTKIVIILSISLTPSIFGQLTRNYVDIWTGFYLFSALIIFAKMFTLDRSKELNFRFYSLTIFIIGLSASSKLQNLIPSILIIILMFLIEIKHHKSFNFNFMVALTSIFLLSSTVPYLRNFIYEQNPFFPISNVFFTQGNASISELSTTVSSFRPNFWPRESIADPLLSLVTPLWVLTVLLLNQVGVYIDKNRIDISAFTYDTTTGGPGILSSVLILIAFLVWLFKFFKQRNIFIKKLNIELILYLFCLIIILFVPGSWWPRYGMAIYLIFLVLSVRYLEKFRSTLLTYFILLSATLPSLFGLLVFQNYDSYSNHRNIYFNSKYGLDSPPNNFISNCEKIAILEPRPTFTSFIWESNCGVVNSLPSDTRIFPNDFFIVANHEIDFESLGSRKICRLGAWFDPNLTYGTFLYSPIDFPKDLCYNSKLEE